MSHDLDDLIARLRDEEPPPLPEDRAAEMVRVALDAAELEAPSRRARWPWVLGLAATLLVGVRLAEPPAPLPVPVSVEVEAPEVRVVQAWPGAEVLVEEARPVELALSGGAVRIEGSGRAVVEAVAPLARLRVDEGRMRVTWRPRDGAPLHLVDTTGGAVLLDGVLVVERTPEGLRWTVEEGEARPIVPEPPPPPPPRPSAPSWDAAEAAMAAGDTEAAVAALRALVAEWPDHPSADLARLDLARLLSTRDPASARAACEEVLSRRDGALAEEARRLLRSMESAGGGHLPDEPGDGAGPVTGRGE